jgi:hypothetical protein
MLFFSAIHAQENLVFNPSAEETEKSKPIHFYNTVYNQPGVYFVDGWFNPNGSSADYYNRDKSTLKGHGMNKARTGEGRLAIVASSMSWNDTVNFLLYSPDKAGMHPMNLVLFFPTNRFLIPDKINCLLNHKCRPKRECI